MNIENLQYFVKIVDEKSISKAAESVHITQSALTQILKKLEHTLKCELLIRSNKGVELNEYGALVYEYAKSMQDSYESMLSRLSCLTDGCFNIIIKPCCSLDNNIIPNTLFQIKNAYKNIKLDVILDGKYKIISEVKTGICDIGLVMGQVDDDEMIDIIKLGKEEIVLVSGFDYPIDDEICLCALDNYKLIDFSLGSYANIVKEFIATYQYKDKQAHSYTPFFSIDSIPAIKTLVESNFGISFLPYSSAKKEIKNGQLKMVKISEFNLVLDINLLTKKNDTLSSLMIDIKNSFITIASDLFKTI